MYWRCPACNKDLAEAAEVLGRENVAALHKAAHVEEATTKLLQVWALTGCENPNTLGHAFIDLIRARALKL